MFPTWRGKQMPCSLIEQMDGTHFPLTPDNLPSQYECVTERDTMAFLRDHGFHISQIATNHPGSGYGYRIESHDLSVVYLTDNELHPPNRKTTGFDEFVQFCKHADVLIHDAQYLEGEMPHKRGWGHSLVTQACELAVAAEVNHLILYHHDPERTDDELDAIQQDARSWFHQKHHEIMCTAGYEGLVLNFQ